jgi:hypothetical protein
MLVSQESVPVAGDSATEARERVCPNCGTKFPAGGRGLGKVHCSKACRVQFNNRAKAEGAVIVALVKAHHQLRHAKPGTREAEVCSMARRELAEITRMLIESDEEAGRPPLTDYVETLLSNTLYVDRTRKF